MPSQSYSALKASTIRLSGAGCDTQHWSLVLPVV